MKDMHAVVVACAAAVGHLHCITDCSRLGRGEGCTWEAAVAIAVPGAGTFQSPPQVPGGGTIAMNAGARVKCETPAAVKMRPSGTGHV